MGRNEFQRRLALTNSGEASRRGITRDQFLERVILDTMRRMGCDRAHAEVLALKLISVADKIVGKDESFDQPRVEPEGSIQASPRQHVLHAEVSSSVPNGAARKSKVRKKPKANQRKAGQLSKKEISKLPSLQLKRPARTAKERLEQAFRPDDGRPRRGGSPFLQGGSPGLGRRR